MSFRFKLGTQVLCRTGAQEWSAGKVVDHNYREDDWPPGRTAPYQVELEEGGRLIFVPRDTDELCRLLEPAWWGEILSKPASHFASNPSASVLQMLCDEMGNGNVNETDHQGRSALVEVARLNWLNGAIMLIQMKADPNLGNKTRTNPLHLAAISGVSVIETLIDGKADPNCQDVDPEFDPEFTSKTFGNRVVHRTPLHYACLEGNTEAVSVLIKAGATLDIPDAQFKTPLHLAIEEEKASIIEVLLRSKADTNLGNQEEGMQTSSLIVAARKGDSKLVAMLIEASAGIDHKGKQGMTALHMAARGGHVDTVQVLLEAGADKTVKSQCGTALELARTKGNAELLQVFGESCLPAVRNISSLDASQKAALFLE
jgi:hypothetical protein